MAKELKDIMEEMGVPMGTDIPGLIAKIKGEEDERAKGNFGGNGKSGGGKKFVVDERQIQLVTGDTTVRILPPYKKGMKEFYEGFLIHNIGGKIVTCFRKDKFDKVDMCPTCQLVRFFFSTNDEADKALGRMFNSQIKYYYNAIVREYIPANPDETKKFGIDLSVNPLKAKILCVGKKLHGKIMEFNVDTKDYGDLTNIETGFDFVIVKKMVEDADKKKYPNYESSRPRRSPSKLASTTDDIVAIIKSRYNLDEIIQASKITKEAMVEMLKDYFRDNSVILDKINSGLDSVKKPNYVNPSEKDKTLIQKEQHVDKQTPKVTNSPAPTPTKTVAEESVASEAEVDGFEEYLEDDADNKKSNEIPF